LVKQAIIVRKDLNMRKGKLAAQVAHASMNIFLNKAVTTSSNLIVGISKDTKEWLETSYTKIVLGCNSLEDLYQSFHRNTQKSLASGMNCVFDYIN